MSLARLAKAHRPVVLTVLWRHTQDAAFYWQQLDSSLTEPGRRAERLLHFSRLLAAHLEGLEAAGSAGLAATREALTRWRKPGEAFAAARAAIALPIGPEQSEALDAVLAAVARLPDLLLRGLISALAWAPSAQAVPWLRQALSSGDVVQRVASLRAHALRDLPVPDWLQQAQHASPFVRAAACRCAPQQALPLLTSSLAADADLMVRAESVLAWARLVPLAERSVEGATEAASLLWRCVAEQLAVLAAATGWNRLQAQRRLARWLRHLAWLAPLGHPGVPQLLAQLPPRLALDFVLHHGDPVQLALVLSTLNHPHQARWAGWVWQCLTGVNIAATGLALPDPPVDLDAPLTTAQHDADHGLPLPDPAAVSAHPASRISAVCLPAGQRLLMGQPVEAHALRALLDPAADQPQALRFVAAHALAQLHPAYALNLRASPEVQAAQLSRMGVQVGA
jgi:hypothetical protein